MFRRLFISLFLILVFSQGRSFAFDEVNLKYEPGECDYFYNSMQCGTSATPPSDNTKCKSGDRCFWDASKVGVFPGNPVQSGGANYYIGICKPATSDFPCTSVANGPQLCTPSSSTSLSCGDSICPLNQVCVPKIETTSESPFKVTNCFNTPDCFALENGFVNSISGVCVDDASCEVPGICETNEDCLKYPGTICPYFPLPGQKNKICESIGCNLPSYANAECSTSTGCDKDQFCVDTLLDGLNNRCSFVDTKNEYISDCFVSIGSQCGIGLNNIKDISFPINRFCKNGDSCLDPVTGNKTTQINLYPDASTNSVCATCVSRYTACQGTEAYPGSLSIGMDDCCDPTRKCIEGSCNIKPTEDSYVYCSSAKDFIKPGEICQYKGFDDFCAKCSIDINGENTSTDIDGNRRCLSLNKMDDNNAVCKSDCACSGATPKCDGGVCVASTTCISPGAPCGPNPSNTNVSAPCCSASGTYTCAGNGTSLLSFICTSPVCDAVMAGTTSCIGNETCCKSPKPFCGTDGKCKEEVDCTGADGTCCSYGTACSNGACVPTDDPKCSPLNPPIEGAGGYTGPKISIIDLFGNLGAILYPAAIGLGLFFVIKAGYEIMVSEGNPDAIKSAQESLTSAVMGIIFIILSSAILRVIINSLLS